MVGYHGPLWVVFGLSRGLCGRSSYDLGTPVGCLGPLSGPMLAVLGRPRGLCGRSWAVLWAMLAVLGRSWGLCGRSWAALGAYVGGLGRSWGVCWRSSPALGWKRQKNMTNLNLCLFLGRERDLCPRGVALGRSWGLCGRSWPLLGPMLPVLGCSWGLCSRSEAGLGPKSGPGLSGKAIWKADQGRKVAQTRAGRRSGQVSETLNSLNPPKHLANFLYRCTYNWIIPDEKYFGDVFDALLTVFVYVWRFLVNI